LIALDSMQVNLIHLYVYLNYSIESFKELILQSYQYNSVSIGITLNWSILDIANSVSTTKWYFVIIAEDDSVEL